MPTDNMDPISTSHQFGSEILKAIGIENKLITGIIIEINPNKAASVTIERLLTVAEADEITDAIQRYELVLKPNASPD